MFGAIRRWRRGRTLATSAIPDGMWRDAVESLPFLAIYTDDEMQRLRDLVVVFLAGKSIVGGGGFAVTPLMRVVIAVQACVLILNIDASYFDGWEAVIVYADEFVVMREFEDDAGVVHRGAEALAGEASPRGPVVLSWSDIAASADWAASGMNLVIHEFAHKLDMRDGDANGCPPLPANLARGAWQAEMSSAFAHFCERVDRDEETIIDAYAADDPAEFFAVLSEVFFVDPAVLLREYPAVYGLFAAFYRQDPASRRAGLRRTALSAGSTDPPMNLR